MTEEIQPSYRALFSIRGLPVLVGSMILARIAGQMVSLVLVLFALDHYASAAVAGAATFLSIAPGLLASPIAGALLDRHGRTRLMVLDYALGGLCLWLIAALATADALPVPLLLVIVSINALTGPLSNTGVRTLFPILVPKELWERANAVDSNGYVMASIFGPALAGVLVASFGAPAALAVTGALFAVAALVTTRIHDPAVLTESGPLLADAWRGVMYVARHPTLNALALSISVANIGWGLFFIALPVLVLQRLGGDAAYVGNLFALLGLSAFAAVFFMGRVSTRGRERMFFAIAMLGQAFAFAIALFSGGHAELVALAMLVLGLAAGPFDVTLFTVRQRRTDPAWMGRAFAVSMALNFAGFPIGSAIGGALVPISLEVAIVVAILAQVTAAILAQRIPRED
ncbi:MAG TPA: MFS transporter [Candidatus Limnocylindrales bacterium]|nr:MFS transporter [Candidatus Limnocylindrales bacterium]